MSRLALIAVAFLTLAVSLAACTEKPSPNAGETVAAMGASVRTNPNAGAPWAAYFTLLGGTEDRVITGLSADGAGRAELHESRMEGGLMTMAALSNLSIPARGEVQFRQGGKHVMLFDVTPEARAAGRMTLTISFDDGSRLPVELAFAPQPNVGSAPPAPMPGPLIRPDDPRIEGDNAYSSAQPDRNEMEPSEVGHDAPGEHEGH